MFFLFLFVCNCLIPAALLAAGIMLKKSPPKNPNALLGYRTSRSRQSKEAWEYAQRRFGEIMTKWSIPLLIVTAAVQLPFRHADEDILSILSLVMLIPPLVALAVVIAQVEKELKAKFGDGKRR